MDLTGPTGGVTGVLADAVWRKSSRSGSNGGDCVEVAGNLAGVVALRDSTVPHGPVLAVSPAEFRAFLHATRHGRFDRPYA